jgi:hypothetical protein
MRRALVVGIDDYPDQPLSACSSDARRVHERLRSNADGSPGFESLLVCNPEQRITAALLQDLLRRTLSQHADQAVLYFAGHGGVDEAGGYLLAQDSQGGTDGIRMADVLRMANDSPVRDVVVLLDCCSAGELGHLDHREDRALIDEGLSIIAAARSDEKAVEREGGGLFTTLLCEALDGGAADVRGLITVASLYAYLDESLGSWEQRPQLKAYVSRLVPLRRCEPLVPDELLRRLTVLFPSADAQRSLVPANDPGGTALATTERDVIADLQRYRAAKLVEPVASGLASEVYRLTPLGRRYHRLASRGRI